jgi:hypothetical protein
MRLHLHALGHTVLRHFARSLVALLCALLTLVTVSTTHAQQNWRWANSLPASVQWKDVAFGNGLYVAVGLDATIATSPDGIAWTIRRQATALATLNGVEFANGLFVAVGQTSPIRLGAALIMTSTDGANWSLVDSVADTVNAQLLDVTYGGGTWVAVGFGSAKVLTSTDARTWTIRGTPGFAIPAKITYGAGRFVASGSGNTALTSTDGITWTNPTVVASTNTLLEGAAFGSGKFVLVGRDSNFNAAAFTSTDGTTWTPANPIAGTANSTGFIAVGASPTGFVAAGGNLVYSSVDGVSWTARTSALPSAPRQLGPISEGVSSATFAGTQFFVVGNYGSITTSPDGNTWTRRSSGTIADLGAVLHDGTRFVASGSGGTILTSPDGSAWTQLTTGSTADFNLLAYSGARYVTAGFSGIYHSTNLTTWTAVAGTTFDRWTAIAYGGGRFVVANSATTLGTRTSTDGVTWSAATTITGAGGNTSALVHGNGLFVLTMVGFGSTPAKIYTSADGTGWAQRAADLLPIGTSVFSIAFGNGRFVALTGNQRALTSTDGINWTSHTLPATPAFTRIRFLAGQFYATSSLYGATSYSSTDGVIWSAVSASFGPNLLNNQSSTGGYPHFALNGSTVVAVGPQGMILRGELPVASTAGRLINLSVLTDIATAGDSFTLGYVVGGTATTGSKPLVIRAAGPSLGALGVGGTLDDPKLETFAGSTSTGVNDNWGGSAQLTAALSAVGAFPYTGPTSRDAAVAASITTRDNSVAVSAAGTGTGKVIAEIYDATPAANFTATTPRLLNVSVRKHLGTGLTAGFVLGGGSPTKVLIRAVGPGLAAFGVEGTVADPQLTLFNSSSTRVDANDNWGGTAALTAAFASVGAFALPGATSRDAALLVTLPPGLYSVEVTGVANTTGTALVEVYEVP